MTSKLTRDRLAEIAQFGFSSAIKPANDFEIKELARLALAAMESEPHTDDELSNLLWYSQEATCHSDPNYYCEFQRLATPGLIAGIIRELQERRKAESDCELVILYRQVNPVNGMKTYWAELDPEEFRHLKQHTDENAEFITLYRHAQPALVIPDEMTAEQAYEIGYYYGDPVNVFARGANWMRQHIIDSTLAAAQHDTPALNSVQSVVTVPGKWIPVSERMPDENTEQQVLACFKGGDISTLYYFEGRWDDAYGIVPIRQDVTHWMPLPAAPQEVKDGKN
ncbi:DUF551 domain-containing protein [Klebsiella quasipneumoniae]|uniref:DUF551 domain-containing protein n=2 Tax=Klebsiella pneumoniae complex TaxID=3390273 RepID=UPI00350F509F